MDFENISALVLAAGKGTRMKSEHAKVLHEVFFAPMVHHVLDAIQALHLKKIVVVTGYRRVEVENSLSSNYQVTFAWQHDQIGTGHAVLAAEEQLRQAGGTVLILCGDTPLIRPQTLKDLLDDHLQNSSRLTVMTTKVDNPKNYGRIISGSDGEVVAIVEEKDADAKTRKIKEINAGVYCADIDFLFDAVKQVGNDNQQGEVYLTDIVGIAVDSGVTVNRFICKDHLEILGVNSRHELAQAHEILQERRNKELMASGITLIHPETICIEKTVAIGTDTVIYPNVFVSGKTTVGKGCVIEPFAILHNCQIGDSATISANSNLTGHRVARGEKVPPHTVIRLSN